MMKKILTQINLITIHQGLLFMILLGMMRILLAKLILRTMLMVLMVFYGIL